MKTKISPDEYREILESLKLDKLYLIELNTKYDEKFVTNRLNLDVKERYRFEQKGNILNIFYNYGLTAKDINFEKPALAIKSKYIVKYKITGDILVKEEFMEIFSDLTVSLLLWTYFRELVNNMVYRMGLPPLILPMQRRIQKR